MSYTEITNKVNELASNWEQFKIINERRLKEIEKKGSADPLTELQLKKLNENMDNYQESLARIETALARPNLETKPEYANIYDNLHRKAFCNYLRKGLDSELLAIEQKSLNLNDRSSGYLVTSRMSVKIAESLTELSPMRKLANVIEISSDMLELIEDRMEAFAGWTQEVDNLDQANTPVITKKAIPVHELYAQPKITQKLLDDSIIDIETWLANKLIDIFTRKENAAFINGDGIGKPRGLLTYEAGKEWGKIEHINSGVNGKITAESLITLFFSLKEIYAVKAKFLMSRDAIQTLRMLKDNSSGRYLWQPGLEAKTPDTILGSEVIQAADMPAIQENSIPIAYGDFRQAYQIVDRQGVRMLRDPFTNKPFIKFYTTKRVGSDVVNFEAVKLLKLVG